MRFIQREWERCRRRDTFRLVPIGDTHVGSMACNERLLRRVVKNITEDDTAYWIGMGDYCEFINLRDPRFEPGVLADWITTKALGDLSKAQRDRFLDIIEPIANKCLALVCGNHEGAIQKHYERAIFNEIVTGIKERARFDEDHPLGIGVYGWLRLRFHWGKKSKHPGSATLDVNLHHGFTAGRLAGAKALNIERWLWNHDADLVIFGHCHDQLTKPVVVEGVDRSGRLVRQVRRGMYSGTFIETVNENGPAIHSERSGYFPTATGCPEAILRPGAQWQRDRVKVLM